MSSFTDRYTDIAHIPHDFIHSLDLAKDTLLPYFLHIISIQAGVLQDARDSHHLYTVL